MAWFTIEDATELGPSRETWLARVDAEEVSSYEDEWGRRWLWVDETLRSVDPWKLERDMLPVWDEVASLRREVIGLRARGASRPEPQAVVLEPVEPVVFQPLIQEVEPAPVVESDWPSPASGDAERILELYRAAWQGSDRELERAAGLPKAFLAKAKKGQRNGPKSAATWARLEAFLRSLGSAQCGVVRRAA